MTKFLKDIVKPKTRHWLYRVAIAVLSLLAGIGIVTEELVPLIIGVIGAILAVGVADGNVPEDTEFEVEQLSNDSDNKYEIEDNTSENFNKEVYEEEHSRGRGKHDAPVDSVHTPLYNEIADKWDDKNV